MHGRVCVSDGIRPLYIGIRIHVHVTYVGQWFHMTTTTKQHFHLFLSTSVRKDDNYLWISTRIKINIIIKSSTQKKKKHSAHPRLYGPIYQLFVPKYYRLELLRERDENETTTTHRRSIIWGHERSTVNHYQQLVVQFRLHLIEIVVLHKLYLFQYNTSIEFFHSVTVALEETHPFFVVKYAVL